MKMPRRSVVVLAGALWTAACAPRAQESPPPSISDPPPSDGTAAELVTIDGKLLGDLMNIGAETTGWAIEQPQADGKVRRVDVDCTKVAQEAAELKGAPVRASGTWEDRDYVERGPIRVLIIAKLEALP